MEILKTHQALLLSGLFMASYPAIADLQDPTRPPDYLLTKAEPVAGAGLTGIVVSESGFVLSSTMISDTRRAAVINGQVVTKGDMLGDMRVVDIKPYKVLLKGDKERIILTLIREGEQLIREPVNEEARK